MHQLPLLVRTAPVSQVLVTVRLKPGKWRFTADTVDTEFFVRLSRKDGPVETVLHGKADEVIDLIFPHAARVIITKPGTEKHITILATHYD